MKIGIDIDGVLTDIEQWQFDYGSKFFSKYDKSIKNVSAYELRNIFEVSKELEDEFWNEYLYEYIVNEPARKFSKEIIEKLKEDGSEIYIITSRYLTDEDTERGEKMRETVKEWLKKYEIIYDKIIFAREEKLDICLKNDVSVMIEDSPKNINSISTKLPVICFDAEYNKECEGDNIYRACSWYDIYNILEKR